MNSDAWMNIFTQIKDMQSHANWKNTDKWSLTRFKRILKISHSNYLQFCSNSPEVFAIFSKNVFVICVEAIIYLLFYNLHDCTFNFFLKETEFRNILEAAVRRWSAKLLFLKNSQENCIGVFF